MAKHRDRDYYEFLDAQDKKLHEDVEVTYILDNISQLSDLEGRLERLQQDVLSKYRSDEYKIEAYPERDQMFLQLPRSSMTRVYTSLSNLGFKLFHQLGIGYAN